MFEIAYRNTFQEELSANPFENSGGMVRSNTTNYYIDIQAYDWSNEKDGYLELKIKKTGGSYKLSWCKHSMMGLGFSVNGEDMSKIDPLVLDTFLQIFGMALDEFEKEHKQ